MASQTTCCSYRATIICRHFFVVFSKIIINHHFSNASYLALLFFTGIIILFSPSMTISCCTIDIITILGNPIALTVTTFEILLGNLKSKAATNGKYGRTSFETYRDDFVISGYFIWSLTNQESKSVSKAPTNNLTSFVS
jgi:hypothetical protein